MLWQYYDKSIRSKKDNTLNKTIIETPRRFYSLGAPPPMCHILYAYIYGDFAAYRDCVPLWVLMRGQWELMKHQWKFMRG